MNYVEFILIDIVISSIVIWLLYQKPKTRYGLESNAFANIHVLVEMAEMDGKIDPDMANKIKKQAKLGAIYIEEASLKIQQNENPPAWHEIVGKHGRKT